MEGFSFSVAFGAGVLAVLNPCALAMIPAYVALRAQAAASRQVSVVIVSGAAGLAAGFIGVFAAVALLLAVAGRLLLQAVPAIAGLIGVWLVVLGVRTLLGHRVHFALPAARIRGGPDTLAAQALFGATYALASLGCALPVFLIFAVSGLGVGDARLALANLAAFAAGVGVTLLALVFVAVAAQGARERVPGGGPLARYLGGTLIAGAGLYLLYVQLGWLVGYPIGLPTLPVPR